MPKNLFKNKYTFLALAAFLVPILIYYLNFHFRYYGLDLNFPKVSTSPANWGVFGDFIGGIANPLLSIINIIVVILLAKKVYELESSREKVNQNLERQRQSNINTFEMMKEWDSESMRKARYNTFYNQILNAGHTKEKDAQDIIPFNDLNKDDRLPVIRVIEFFDRLTFLYDKELINREETKDYFKKDYEYFDKYYFSVQRTIYKGDLIYGETFKEHICLTDN